MKTYKVSRTDLEVSRIAYGCMHLGGKWDHSVANEDTINAAEASVLTAFESGITLFDHADIYVFGKSESVFGQILKRHPGLRDQIILQSKCGIIFSDSHQSYAVKKYDTSHEYIVRSVENSLKRLQTDRLDLFMLHRPDALVEPDQVAEAFDQLHAGGKVRYFGVSNHTAPQVELLAKNVRQPLVVNQIEISLARHSLINDGIVEQPGGTLEYCRMHDICVQAWSPLANGKLFGVTDHNNPLRPVSELISTMAMEKHVSSEAIMLAWLLRHPAGIQPIIGTMRSDRIKKCVQADEIELTREEWYALFTAARGGEVP